MRDGQAGLGHPPWRGGAGLRCVCKSSRGGDLNALRLDASAILWALEPYDLGLRSPYIVPIYPYIYIYPF